MSATNSVEMEQQTAKRVSAMGGRGGMEIDPRQQEQQQIFQEGFHGEMAGLQPGGGSNVGPDERAVSVAAGAVVALLGLRRASLPGLACAAVGAGLVYRGITGSCSVYKALGINTAQPDGENAADEHASGIQITTAFTINKPAEELYRYWRNFENLPSFMEHLESVTVSDVGKSHWVVKAPKLLGGKVEWDAEIIEDRPNELISWRSLAGSSVSTAGQVRFQPALGDRGTEVHVWMNYVPPGGRLGHWVTSLLGENPKRVVREELRNFKRIMEIGEILTVEGQPRGSCMGQGMTQHESDWKPLFT